MSQVRIIKVHEYDEALLIRVESVLSGIEQIVIFKLLSVITPALFNIYISCNR